MDFIPLYLHSFLVKFVEYDVMGMGGLDSIVSRGAVRILSALDLKNCLAPSICGEAEDVKIVCRLS